MKLHTPHSFSCDWEEGDKAGAGKAGGGGCHFTSPWTPCTQLDIVTGSSADIFFCTNCSAVPRCRGGAEVLVLELVN